MSHLPYRTRISTMVCTWNQLNQIQDDYQSYNQCPNYSHHKIPFFDRFSTNASKLENDKDCVSSDKDQIKKSNLPQITTLGSENKTKQQSNIHDYTQA